VVAEAPAAEAPRRTVDVRTTRYAISRHLRLLGVGPAWRGYAAFMNQDPGRVFRSATIFSASDPAALREHLMGFEKAALIAFLCSTHSSRIIYKKLLMDDRV